jgi:hypothetical protein
MNVYVFHDEVEGVRPFRINGDDGVRYKAWIVKNGGEIYALTKDGQRIDVEGLPGCVDEWGFEVIDVGSLVPGSYDPGMAMDGGL